VEDDIEQDEAEGLELFDESFEDSIGAGGMGDHYVAEPYGEVEATFVCGESGCLVLGGTEASAYRLFAGAHFRVSLSSFRINWFTLVNQSKSKVGNLFIGRWFTPAYLLGVECQILIGRVAALRL
jgi:hypothetical protein